MLKLNEQVFNVTWNTEATATICIVPFDINILIEKDIAVRRTANGLGDSFFGFN